MKKNTKTTKSAAKPIMKSVAKTVKKSGSKKKGKC